MSLGVVLYILSDVAESIHDSESCSNARDNLWLVDAVHLESGQRFEADDRFPLLPEIY
jgi:hypothetical protein